MYDPSVITSALRERWVGEYWVVQSPLLLAPEQLTLGVVRSGQYVRIPVFGYQLQRSLAHLFGGGIDIGMRALLLAQPRLPTPPTELILVLGTECKDLTAAPGGADKFLCFAGIALRC